MVGARGFELLPHSFVQYRVRSPVPRKQRLLLHFPLFPNLAEHRQTAPDFDKLLHTHYTRKAFLPANPGFATTKLLYAQALLAHLLKGMAHNRQGVEIGPGVRG